MTSAKPQLHGLSPTLNHELNILTVLDSSVFLKGWQTDVFKSSGCEIM